MTTRMEIRLVGVFAATVLGLAGCAQHGQHGPADKDGDPAGHAGGMVTKAAAKMDPTQGNDVRGMVTFTKNDKGIRVVADLTGLTPGEHGFHIHEKGDCTAPDGSSAGGHFNPAVVNHGAPDAAVHHVGDLGNITADQSGKAHLDRTFSFLTFEGTNSILGRGVIVHANKDDFSQPVGNAGARLSCGVIKPQ